MTRYEIIKLEANTAYLLDTVKGRVIIVPVEDFTGSEYDIAEKELPPPPPRRRRIQVLDESSAIDEEIQDVAPAEKTPTRRRASSIIPPHLRGVFSPQDSSGAAIEKRVV